MWSTIGPSGIQVSVSLHPFMVRLSQEFVTFSIRLWFKSQDWVRFRFLVWTAVIICTYSHWNPPGQPSPSVKHLPTAVLRALNYGFLAMGVIILSGSIHRETLPPGQKSEDLTNHIQTSNWFHRGIRLSVTGLLAVWSLVAKGFHDIVQVTQASIDIFLAQAAHWNPSHGALSQILGFAQPLLRIRALKVRLFLPICVSWWPNTVRRLTIPHSSIFLQDTVFRQFELGLYAWVLVAVVMSLVGHLWITTVDYSMWFVRRLMTYLPTPNAPSTGTCPCGDRYLFRAT